MYGEIASHASQAYRNVALDTGIETSDPHGLISMLLDGAIERAGAARIALSSGDYSLAAKKLGSVASIVAELRSCVDHEQGGELAANLEALYDYVQRRIAHATRHRDQDAILEAMDLLAQVYSAWMDIGKN